MTGIFGLTTDDDQASNSIFSRERALQHPPTTRLGSDASLLFSLTVFFIPNAEQKPVHHDNMAGRPVHRH